MFRSLLPLIAVALLAACANTQGGTYSSMGMSCCKDSTCKCCSDGYCPMKDKR
jgi:hypothetical protein